MATLLLEVGVMFAAIALAGLVAARAGVSAIPLYILAGLALNEFVLGAVAIPERLELGVAAVSTGGQLPYVTESAFVTVGAELGIVFLLFFLGVEFNLDRLLADRARIGRAGLVDLAVNFGVGLVLGWVLFGDPVAAVVVAGIVYISSSAVITKTMLDLGWIANPESGPLLGVLVFEDLVIAVYLALLSAVVLGGGNLASAAGAVGVALAFLLGLGVLVYAGTAALQRLLETPSAEHFVLRTVATTVLLAGAALSLGVSEAVAAFFVGMAFSATDHAHAIEEALSPLRDTFAAVFFFWIGLVTDPSLLPGVLDLLVVAVVVTAPAKLVSGVAGGRIYGLDDRRSLRVGLGMVTRGEFSLIVAATALAAAGATLDAAVAERIYAFTVAYVLVMSVLGTVLMGASGVFERRLPGAGSG